MDARPPSTDDAPSTISVQEAMAALGKSEATILRWIKKGKLTGKQEPIPSGFQWRIVWPRSDDAPSITDDPPPTADGGGDHRRDEGPTVTADPPPTDAMVALVRDLHAENLRLAEAVAMYQERSRTLEMEIARLRNPPPILFLPAPRAPAPIAVESQPEASPDDSRSIWARVKAFFGGGG